MNVYLVHVTYHNGITKAIIPFSSAKKAQDYVDDIVGAAVELDKWLRTDRTIYNYSENVGVTKAVVITPPSGNVKNSETFQIIKQEVL
jgi:hypothetical protein